MILLEQNVLLHQGVATAIKEWVVWFETVEGLCTTFEEAVESANRTDMPLELIRPVAVAIGTTGHHEVSRR